MIQVPNITDKYKTFGKRDDVERLRLVEIAKSWLGTPYHSNAMVKGPRGGTDCAMLLVGVYREANWVGSEFDPRPYPPHWHLHKNEEWYLNHVQSFSTEISEIEVQPADIVLFKVGRLFAHGAIIVSWPLCIAARAPSPVSLEDIMRDNIGKHALARVEKRFFSLKEGA